MLAMAQQQQTQLQIQGTGGSSGASGTAAGALSSLRGASQTGESWEPLPYARGSSITASSLFSAPAPQGAAAASSAGSAAAASAASGNNKDSKTSGGSGSGGPTLPPHPKQKPMPPTLPPHPKQKGNAQTLSSGLPNHMSYPPTRLSSLARGLSRGISNLSRGLSSESQSSAMMLRNSWEDKFFSMLMLGENDAAAAAAAQNAMAQNMAAMGHQQGHGAPGSAQMPSSGANGLSGLSALTDRSFLAQFGGQLPRLSSEMSSVSASAAALGQR